MNYRKGSLVPKQEEAALAFTSHSCTPGVYLPDVTVVLRTKTEVIVAALLHLMRTQVFIEWLGIAQIFTTRFVTRACTMSVFGSGGSC